MRYKDVSVRKKILLSNFLMVFIPILFVLLILFCILFAFSIFTNSSSTTIRNVLLNSSNYGPTLFIKNMNDELANNDSLTSDMKTIFHQLEDLNIHLYIEKNNTSFYVSEGSTFVSIQQSFQRVAQIQDSYELPYIVWNQKGIAYAANLNDKHNDILTIMLVGENLKLPAQSYESWENTKLQIKIGIVASGIIIISLITLLGVFLTYKLSKHILHPIDDLNRATKAIGSGDLSSTLPSDQSDELGELCQNFERMRQQLLESEQLKIRYDENQKELIAGISHDLNTPLTSIQGYVNGLLDGIADTPEKQVHYLHIISEQVERTNQLVEQLFLLSKLDLNQQNFDDVTLDMKEYIEEWLHNVSPSWIEQQVYIQFECENTTYPVCIDAQQFIRVFDNLIQNSYKYRKGNQTHIQITMQKNTENLHITICDDGIGIQNKDALRLFDRFYRSDPSRNNAQGNGLGLAIVKRIIEHSSGHIEAHGELDKGLCITITLPLKEAL